MYNTDWLGVWQYANDQNYRTIYDNLKQIKSVAYSPQGSHTGQLEFCKWLVDGSTTE